MLEYWIVEPDAKTVTQLELCEGRYVERFHVEGTLRSSAFPGFEVALVAIF